MQLKKITFLKVLILVIVILAIMIFINARKISGLTFEKQSDVEYTATLNNEIYTVLFRPKHAISPLFGMATTELGTKFALVRDDLPKSAKNFVMHHEIYHLQDHARKSTLSMEIHATLGAIPYAPLGFLQTVILTLTDADRRNLYSKKFF